jgi:hypothetical protein
LDPPVDPHASEVGQTCTLTADDDMFLEVQTEGCSSETVVLPNAGKALCLSWALSSAILKFNPQLEELCAPQSLLANSDPGLEPATVNEAVQNRFQIKLCEVHNRFDNY